MLALADFMEVETACIVGGNRVSDDVIKLKQRVPHVVVGTPGRIHHLLKNRALG